MARILPIVMLTILSMHPSTVIGIVNDYASTAYITLQDQLLRMCLLISDLTSKMQSDWPTLSCPSNSGLTFWGHEWDKHGTCSESVLNQHDYFPTSLSLKNEIDLLQALQSTGIQPNRQMYSLSSIKSAIKGASGYTPWIECNNDPSGNSQLYQIYLCVDSSASGFIECPVFPNGKCGASIEFPKF
ncbi:hypothetical protein OSB04_006795 [Centaurea solstitialis]|uniref:Uncharacterized protein n=1 Tax=Centaurea solstitialis TaxID=347529 RepID=A0AA38WQH3_9ASTR|nr:hypothetical protein OSB04_006795 [Centaurea solstitialis]